MLGTNSQVYRTNSAGGPASPCARGCRAPTSGSSGTRGFREPSIEGQRAQLIEPLYCLLLRRTGAPVPVDPDAPLTQRAEFAMRSTQPP